MFFIFKYCSIIGVYFATFTLRLHCRQILLSIIRQKIQNLFMSQRFILPQHFLKYAFKSISYFLHQTVEKPPAKISSPYIKKFFLWKLNLKGVFLMPTIRCTVSNCVYYGEHNYCNAGEILVSSDETQGTNEHLMNAANDDSFKTDVYESAETCCITFKEK